MSSPVISVVIPTVAGREDHLERCIAAYECDDVELIVIRDRPTCGIAWQEGALAAQGEYIHFTADDLEPHDGWAQPAIDMVKQLHLPAPRIVKPDGSLESCGRWGEEEPDGSVTEMTRIPFMSKEMWEKVVSPMLPIHYYTDNWVSFKASLCQIDTRVVRDYSFTHHWAQARRGAGMTENERMATDRVFYEAACAKERERMAKGG